MAVGQHPLALLGVDIGTVNSRVNLFGISDGKYCLLGNQSTSTSLSPDLHIGAGVGEAMQALQRQTDQVFLKDSGGILRPVDRIGRGVDQVALVTSAGPRCKTALLGLSGAGSIRAGKALIESLPLQPVDILGLTSQNDETQAIEKLIKTRPEIIILAGGEDAGAEGPVVRWIEITRTACSLMPNPHQPVVLYAGNPALEATAKRRLEPITRLQIAPNLQPVFGAWDFPPTQSLLEEFILKAWIDKLPGLRRITALTEDLSGLSVCSTDRMVRYLSQVRRKDVADPLKTGVLSINLGGTQTMLSAGLNGISGTVVDDNFHDLDEASRLIACQAVKAWSVETVSLEEVDQFLYQQTLIPAWVPETRKELALHRAFDRFRLRQSLSRLAENIPWFDYDPHKGLCTHFEPIIASGAVLSHDPTHAGILLTLLDGLQPWGITTLVLDRHQLMPLLGKIGEVEPLLPVHLLSTVAFDNLGTVISVVGDLPLGRTALTIQAETESGIIFTADIHFGTLYRLPVPAGEMAVLDLIPHRQVDVGFGGRGQGGKLKVVGGKLGVVIDARGRPIHLPHEEKARLELLQKWQNSLVVEDA
jgi:hypothetical protein